MENEPRVVWICVPGILNRSRSDGAMDRVVRWIVNHTPHKAVEYDYFALALSRRWFGAQQRRAVELARLAASLRGLRRGAGHSNGVDEWVRALQVRDEWGSFVIDRLDELHLFSGAAEADWDRNGLADAMRAGRVGRVYCYTAGRDRALGVWAKLSRTLGGWMGLGYGNIGEVGPRNVPEDLRGRVAHVVEPTFEHSTWFEREHLERTMRTMTRVSA